jgi:hypothetical protein
MRMPRTIWRLKPGQTIELLIDQDNILQQMKIA